MKRVYVKPSLEGLRIDTNYGLMKGGSGEIGAGQAWAKQQEVEVEEETGIPDKFSNIWGDEEDED